MFRIAGLIYVVSLVLSLSLTLSFKIYTVRFARRALAMNIIYDYGGELWQCALLLAKSSHHMQHPSFVGILDEKERLKCRKPGPC